MLTKILSALAFVVGLFGFYERNRASRSDAKAKRQTRRAESALAESATYNRVDKLQQSVKQKQKQEQLDVEQSLKDGRRDQLDNNG